MFMDEWVDEDDSRESSIPLLPSERESPSAYMSVVLGPVEVDAAQHIRAVEHVAHRQQVVAEASARERHTAAGLGDLDRGVGAVAEGQVAVVGVVSRERRQDVERRLEAAGRAHGRAWESRPRRRTRKRRRRVVVAERGCRVCRAQEQACEHRGR